MMNIDMAIKQLTQALSGLSGYRDCEQLIIRQIIEQIEKGLSDLFIENYLRNLTLHLEANIDTSGDANIQMNCRYVIGFINTLLRAPSWRNWVQAIAV
jgi:transcriptional antiterminator